VRGREMDWYYQHGANFIFPDAWQDFARVIPEGERSDLLAAYHRRLVSGDPSVALPAARAWNTWEALTLRLVPDLGVVKRFLDEDFALAHARIETHYFVNRGFFDSNTEPLARIDRIRKIPAIVIQGRYDLVCPMDSAWDLHQAWPEAEFQVIPDAGHSGFEDSTCSALVDAADRFGPAANC